MASTHTHYNLIFHVKCACRGRGGIVSTKGNLVSYVMVNSMSGDTSSSNGQEPQLERCLDAGWRNPTWRGSLLLIAERHAIFCYPLHLAGDVYPCGWTYDTPELRCGL